MLFLLNCSASFHNAFHCIRIDLHPHPVCTSYTHTHTHTIVCNLSQVITFQPLHTKTHKHHVLSQAHTLTLTLTESHFIHMTPAPHGSRPGENLRHTGFGMTKSTQENRRCQPHSFSYSVLVLHSHVVVNTSSTRTSRVTLPVFSCCIIQEGRVRFSV